MTEHFVEWRDTFSIGVKELDEQHRQLLALVNSLHAALSDRLIDRLEVYDDALKDATDYIEYHFSWEERFMRDIGYPELQAQATMHAYYKSRVAEAQADEGQDRLAPTRFLHFLRDWLLEHIAVEDRKIGAFVARRRPAA
jgi:hemerythrin